MKTFKDFGIKIETNAFIGDKIKISKILNRQIVVHAYKIEKSKYNTGKCLYLQIDLNGTKHIVFTGSNILMDAIQQVPSSGFPFRTTIVEENEMYQFT